MNPFFNTFSTRLGLAAVVTASAAALLAPDASAQSAGTVTLTGATSASCQYSSMSVAPNGAITVTCGSGGTVVAPVCNNGNATASVGGAASLTASCTNNPTSYAWTAGAGAPAVTNASAASTTTGAFASAGTYTYTVTGGNSAGNSQATITVTVAAPTAAPTCTLAPGSATITTGSSTTLTATCDQGPTGYAWIASNVSGPTVPATTTNNQITVGPFATAGSYAFNVLAGNSVGNGAAASTTITVNNPPAGGSCPTVATIASSKGSELINLRYDLKPGQVGSTGFDWPYQGKSMLRFYTIKATNLESPAGLSHTVTISPCQGQIVLPGGAAPNACTYTGGNGGGTFNVGDGTNCVLTPGRYYVSVKQVNAAGTNTCVPNTAYGISYCSTVTQAQ